MSRRGWIFLGVGLGVAVLAVCCIAAVVLVVVGSNSDVGAQLGLGSSNVKYEVVNEGRTESPNRLRWEVDVIFQEDATSKQAVETAAQIARERLKGNPDLKAVVVLAYDSRGEYNRRQPHVLAMVSSDGRGWAGDGNLLNSKDQGDIEVIYATKFEEGKIADFDAFLCPVEKGACTPQGKTSR